MNSYAAALFILLAWTSLSQAKVLLRPRLDGRIVGGESIDISERPFQVSLQLSRGHFCGGSLIAKRLVLTAAHCTDGLKVDMIKVRIGSTFSSRDGIIVGVEQIHQHQGYNSITVDYDFSILKLTDYNASDIISGFVQLPEADADILDGTSLSVSGWGLTQNSLQSNKELRLVNVPKVNQEICHSTYKKNGGITDRMICAGFPKGGKDSCQGDSGGPLVYKDTIVGVVSWGYGCAIEKYPGVYSRVSSVRAWIQEISGI